MRRAATLHFMKSPPNVDQVRGKRSENVDLST
jgi:hypothetical protein